jgi:hypothetical protein
MKYLSLCTIVVLLSCHSKLAKTPEAALVQAGGQQADSADTVLVRIVGAIQGGDPDSCVLVSRRLEPDSGYNKLLAKYICGNLYSNDHNDDQAEMVRLTNRPSFGKMIMLFFDEKTNYDKIMYYGDKSRIPEMRENLLFGVVDCCAMQLHPIADELLKQDIFEGAEVLWDKADCKRLPSLPAYMSRVSTTNFFACADLAAFFHNAGEFGLRDSWLKKAGQTSGAEKDFATLKKLIAKNKKFDISTYRESMYGGM